MTDPADPPDDDLVLIQRFVEHADETAFVRLYRRHSPPVYGLLYRLTGGHEQNAADVLQEAWIRAGAKLHAFRGESQFRTWVTGIALNCFREWRRRSGRDEHSGDVDETFDTHAAASHRESVALDVDQVMRTLPPAFLEILVLHDIEGYTHQEIAALLEIEAGTSKSRLSRARQMFRQRWNREPARGAAR